MVRELQDKSMGRIHQRQVGTPPMNILINGDVYGHFPKLGNIPLNT